METLVWGDARNPNKPYPKRVGICEISTARQDVVTATRLSVCTVPVCFVNKARAFVLWSV